MTKYANHKVLHEFNLYGNIYRWVQAEFPCGEDRCGWPPRLETRLLERHLDVLGNEHWEPSDFDNVFSDPACVREIASDTIKSLMDNDLREHP